MVFCMLQDFENNLKTLISAYEEQKFKADRLEKDFAAIRNQYETARLKIKELEDKVDSLNLRNAFTSSAGENSEAKARIDALIGKIDDALELLQ